MYADNPFDSEDLVEGDPMSVCAYFCYFFMVGYKYRQCKAVVARYVSHFVYILDLDVEIRGHAVRTFGPGSKNLDHFISTCVYQCSSGLSKAGVVCGLPVIHAPIRSLGSFRVGESPRSQASDSGRSRNR
jgi:hypothetical protein